MKYKVLEYQRKDDLERQVNAALKDGWKLVGGVSVAEFEYQHCATTQGLDKGEFYSHIFQRFAQALSKREWLPGWLVEGVTERSK